MQMKILSGPQDYHSVATQESISQSMDEWTHPRTYVFSDYWYYWSLACGIWEVWDL